MMRIDFQYTAQPAEPERKPPQTSGAGNPSAASIMAAAPGEDQAELSRMHSRVAALAGQASELREIRQERVEALRHAIASGHYQPDPEKVAGAMLEWMPRRPAA